MVIEADIITRPDSGEYDERIYDNESPWNSQAWTYVKFVNSDYTYEDMQKRKVQKDHHKLLRSEPFKNYDCWVLESIPKDSKDSQYGKRISWIVKDIFVAVKTEFYNKKGKLQKIFTVRKLHVIDGGFKHVGCQLFPALQ